MAYINYHGVICLQEESLVPDVEKHLLNVKHKQSHSDSYISVYVSGLCWMLGSLIHERNFYVHGIVFFFFLPCGAYSA